MRQIDLIIFDLDGTLVDSQTDIINSVNFTLKGLGLAEKSEEEIKRYIGTGIEDLLLQSTGREDLYGKAHTLFAEHFMAHCLDVTKLYSGVKEMLDFFKTKKKSIVTNRKKYSAEHILKALGIKEYFLSIIGGDDVNCAKPDPCPIFKSLDKCGIKDKNRAIMVGDMNIDVKSGKAAGILTCAVTYGIGDKREIQKTDPDFMIDSIEELKEILC